MLFKVALIALVCVASIQAYEDECFKPINGEYPFTDLEYGFAELEPYIIQHTMELHHNKHYKSYTDKCNAAIENSPLDKLDIYTLISENASENSAVRNNCGGYHNHCIFWKFMQAEGMQKPSGQLEEAISNAFGSFENFQEYFDDAASKVFGSGWAWLVLYKNAGGDYLLNICTTPNQDSPIWNENDSTCRGEIVLALDVWEHAYYLQYFNVRDDYISAWWSVTNWRYAEERFLSVFNSAQETESAFY